MNICILSGSSRKNSNTLRLSKATKLKLTEMTNAQIDVINFEDYDFPFFNGTPVDRENPSEFQASVFKLMQKADLIFVYSPEYNWFPSGEMVNLIHQIASEKNADLFDEKVFAFGGVSSGRGGKIPAIQLSYVFGKVINFLNLSSLVSSKIFESCFTQDSVNEEGKLSGDERYIDEFNRFIEYSLNLVKRWKENS